MPSEGDNSRNTQCLGVFSIGDTPCVFCSVLAPFCLSTGLKEVKEHESRLTEISEFNKQKLKHAETEEKNPLPDKKSRLCI